MIESGHMEYVEDKIKKNFIDNHVSYVYEDVCRGDVWNLLSEGVSFNRVGRWWGSKDVEIDILAYDSLGKDIIFGECKYSKQKKGMAVFIDLQNKARVVNWKKDKHFLIEKEFEDECQSPSNIIKVGNEWHTFFSYRHAFNLS